MRVTVMGTGYVGLVSGACFADFGHKVVCVDSDPGRVDSLRRGEVPVYEPGLDRLVAGNVQAGRLSFSGDPASSIPECDAVFIAVGTPSRRGDGFADLSYVYQAAEQIAGLMRGYTVVVNKSTVPVGTGARVEEIIRENAPGLDFSVVSNPEFLREGAAIEDFKRPDRIIVGAGDERARDVMRELYRPLYLNETPIVFTGRATSELTKYAANAFLAMKITFINEMADLCEKTGANVQEVARGIGLDRRIGPKFLNAGPGYGGSCFPKDTLALAGAARRAGAPTRLVEAVVAANDARKRKMAGRIVEACDGSLSGKTVAVLGLAFKPNTDDMRDAPSLEIVPAIRALGARVQAFDPAAMNEARKILDGIVYASGPYQALEGADAVVILTEWDAFRALDLDRVRSLMKAPVMIDLRNIYRPALMEESGFRYYCIGRPSGAAKQ